jgi:hypothetical protein
MQLHFGEAAWQGNLWLQSLVRSLSPLLVNTLDSYVCPYCLAVIFNRMLDLLILKTKVDFFPFCFFFVLRSNLQPGSSWSGSCETGGY